MGLRSLRADLLLRAANPIDAVNNRLGLKAGLMLALLANLIWGSSFLASKHTLEAWGPFTASSLRFAIATLALLGTLVLLGKKIEFPNSTKQWISLVLIATSGFGFLYPLQLTGLKLVTSSLSAAIMLTSPLIVLLLGRVILKEKLSLLKWVAMGLGIAGGIMLLFGRTSSGISTLNTANFLNGTLLTILGSICLATSVILTRKLSKTLQSTSITLWTMAIGFFQLTVAAVIFEGRDLTSVFSHATFNSWMSLLYLALVCSAFCFFIWNQALSLSTPQEIASSMHIKTPTAVLIGVVIGKEVISSQVIAGTLLVMFGVWLSQQSNFWSKK